MPRYITSTASLTALKEYASFVDDEKARILPQTHAPVIGIRSVTRYWDRMPDKRREGVLEFMDCFVSKVNVETSGKLYIDELYVSETESLTGPWRVVSNRLVSKGNGETPAGFYQELRYGWATTLDNTEARIVQGNAQDLEPGAAFKIMYPAVDPAYVQAVVNAARARATATYTSSSPLTIGRTSLTGTLLFGTVTSEIADDGTHNVYQDVVPLATIGDDVVDSLESLNYSQTSDRNILAAFGLEEGVGKGHLFVWRGLPESSRDACLALDRVDFLNTFVLDEAMTTTWAESHAIGDLIQWDDASNETVPTWIDRREIRVVRAVVGFDGSAYTQETALKNGLVVDAWRVPTIKFETRDQGDCVLSVACQFYQWDNLKATAGSAPQAAFVTASEQNQSGPGKGMTKVAEKVPATAALEIADNVTAESSHILAATRVAISDGYATVQASNAAIFDYIVGGIITAPWESRDIFGVNGALAGQVNFWPRIDPTKIDAHITAAKLYTTSHSTGFLVKSVHKDVQADGAYNLTVTLIENDTQITDAEDDAWVVRRSYQEKTTRPPANDNGGVPEFIDAQPEDGYFWRHVYERITCRITDTASAAANHAEPGSTDGSSNPCLYGSYSKPYRKGQYYAERVVARKYTQWHETSLRDETVVRFSEFAGPGEL